MIKPPSADAPCLCHSQLPFGQCCAPYLQAGAVASGPEALMRSRFSAFCLGDLGYLQKTWNPETYPEDLGLDEPSNWISLEILSVEVEDGEAEVEFRAGLIFANKLEILHEVSHFDLVDGAWLYHSGDFENDGDAPKAINKNAPCPCGSGKAFKLCHFE